MNFDNYTNQSVRDFLDGFDTEEDKVWVKAVISLLRKIFPTLDHYVTGGEDKSYIDIRIGQKSTNSRRGTPVFILGKESKINGGGACLWIREKSRNILPENQEWWIKQQNATSDQVRNWLQAIKDKAERDGLNDLNLGQSHVPKDYIGLPEVDPMPNDENLNNSVSLNTVLYGPPGTGKTYSTIDKALEILDREFLDANKGSEDSRKKLKERFDQLVAEGRIAFTTFHQSFSYEDFVEGIRANAVNERIEYKIEDGVFKKIAIIARPKTTLSFDEVYEKLCEEIKSKGLVLETLDQNKPFDIKVSNTRSLSAIPQTGNEKSMSITKENLRELLLNNNEKNWSSYTRSIRKYIEENYSFSKPEEKCNYVLIIDEINRGNIANIFGELITLIEPSKRAGAPEALSVTLPYSKEPFSVPNNLYIIGTMNTADRSLALMDTALRRRFYFIEMMPQPELLADIKVENVNIQLLLERMNARITALYDREHTLGHAFFMPLRDEPTLIKLREVFERQILPLLQEYFFEDWNKIRLIVGKDLVIEHKISSDLFDEAVDGIVNPKIYSIDFDALDKAETYIRIYDKAAKDNV